MVELVKSILKLVIVFVIAWSAVKGEIDNVIRLYDHSISFILLYIMDLSFTIVIRIL